MLGEFLFWIGLIGLWALITSPIMYFNWQIGLYLKERKVKAEPISDPIPVRGWSVTDNPDGSQNIVCFGFKTEKVIGGRN